MKALRMKAHFFLPIISDRSKSVGGRLEHQGRLRLVLRELKLGVREFLLRIKRGHDRGQARGQGDLS